MRAISLVKRIEFEFSGNVVRNALTLGDVDNDGRNELIIGNELGEVAIFKGRDRFQKISKSGIIVCVAVGDVKNHGKNTLVIITADGWCYLYEVLLQNVNKDENVDQDVDEVDGQIQSSTATETQSSSDSAAGETKPKQKDKQQKNPLICVHTQRIPANVKSVILEDVDGDGAIEMVFALTDRVVRSYRWVADTSESQSCGKFIALYKYECAKQIGSITVHHSSDGAPSILVAQPGGTFMRILCRSEGESDDSNDSTKVMFPGSVDYQVLGISRMRNQNISTEILGDFRTCSDSAKSRPYAVATLDGTIMLVQDEVILWAIAVDHQIFALTKLDITGDGTDDIIACSWDGQTYILDQEKNSVRFHLEEPVRAFHSGWYTLDADSPAVTALVYVTFKNTIIMYYDIPLTDLICTKFEPDPVKLGGLFVNKDRDSAQALDYVEGMDKKTKRGLVEYLLYNVKC